MPYTVEYPPDTQAASLWLRNRRKQDWRERHEIEAKVDEKSLLDRYTEEQLITRLMQRREQRRSDEPSRADDKWMLGAGASNEQRRCAYQRDDCPPPATRPRIKTRPTPRDDHGIGIEEGAANGPEVD